MDFWVIYCICGLILSLLAYTNNYYNIKMYFCLYTLFMWGIGAFRDNIGNDYATYEILYYEIERFADYPYLEPGFRIMVILFKELTSNPQIMFIFYSTFTLVFIYMGGKTFIEKSRYYIIFVVLYYMAFNGGYTVSFNVVRQSLAIAIVFWGTKYAIRKQMLKFSICILIATMNHYSAVLLLPIYYISKLNVSFRKSFCIILLFFVVFLSPLGGTLFEKIFSLPLLEYVGYGVYANHFEMAVVDDSKTVNLVTLFIASTYLIGRYVCHDKVCLDKMLCNVSLLYVLLRIIADIKVDVPMVHLLFQRISVCFALYYLVFIIKSIPLLSRRFNIIKYECIISLGIMLIYALGLLVAMHSNPYYTPYKMVQIF